MRRKPGVLLPIERGILEAAVRLQGRRITEFHGFAMAKDLAEHGDSRKLTAHGPLYKALDRLEAAGFLESRWEDPDLAAEAGRPRRRLYMLTSAGAAALAASPTPAPSPRTTPKLATP